MVLKCRVYELIGQLSMDVRREKFKVFYFCVRLVLLRAEFGIYILEVDEGRRQRSTSLSGNF